MIAKSTKRKHRLQRDPKAFYTTLYTALCAAIDATYTTCTDTTVRTKAQAYACARAYALDVAPMRGVAREEALADTPSALVESLGYRNAWSVITDAGIRM